MKANRAELNMMELGAVSGGVTHKNPTPSNPTAPIDQILNGDNYDALAQEIANWLNGDDRRTRKVDNNQDIYDTVI